MHELGYQSSGQSPERSSGETALPAVPLVLSHSGPSPENIAQLAAARIAAAKIRRVVAVANLDGWSTLVLGGIGMIFSLGSPAGFLLGGVMVALGWRQLTAAKNLRRLSIDAPPQLAANQLILCGAISLYAGWNIYTSLTRPSELDPEIQQAIQQYVGSEGSLEAVGYVVVIVGSILIMGSTAWYYRSRSRILADYLAKTPQWILDMQRNGDAL